MKSKLMIAFLLFAFTLNAQTAIQKTYPFSAGQKIKLNFDYPNLIKISSWDKNEISIKGTVSINGSENDDAFALSSVSNPLELKIIGEIKNIKELPHRITVKRNGEKIVFKNKEEFNKYKKENGSSFEMTSSGNDIDIKLEIQIPKNAVADIISTYGTVEVIEYSGTGPLTVKSTYGGVDASLNIATIGELNAETNYGQIYSNLGINFSGAGLKEEDFHTEIKAKPGKGANLFFESTYGNVYLRKKS